MFALSALVGRARDRARSTATRSAALVAQVTLCGVPLLLGRQPRADQRRARRELRAGRSSSSPGTTSRQTTAPFALMASAALMLVVLWQRSPALSIALVGPLLAIALYQRSTFAALRAMRLALTDPLTGLGNHRHFHERLQRELVDGGARRHGAQPLPRRHRRLQADQRPLRPSGRRPRARPGRVAPAPGRRELPARRRRVRRPPAPGSTSARRRSRSPARSSSGSPRSSSSRSAR